MTTIGTEQTPAPVDDPTKVGTTPAAPSSPEPTPPAESPLPESQDPDDIELREAKAAAKTEEAAGKPAQVDAVAGAEPPAEPPPTPAPEPPPAAPPPAQPEARMIPKAAFDERLGKERDRADKAAQDAAYWRGVAEARAAGTAPATAPGAPPAPAAPPAPTPEQKLAEIHTEIDVLAKKFDDGEITMTDFKRQERELTAKEQSIREESLLSRVTPPAPAAKASSGDDSLYLETLTVDLEAKHPWVAVFEAAGNEADWAYLTAQARANLKERNIDPSDGTTIARYHLRQEVAALADQYGPGMLTARAQAKGVAIPGQTPAAAPPASAASAAPAPPAAPPQPKPMSPDALARQAKLGMHASAPPSLPAMSGTPGAAPGEVTDAQLDAMSDEDIGKLPDAVRNKLRGIS